MWRHTMTKILNADPLASLFLLQLPFPHQSLPQITMGSNLLFAKSVKLDFISTMMNEEVRNGDRQVLILVLENFIIICIELKIF